MAQKRPELVDWTDVRQGMDVSPRRISVDDSTIIHDDLDRSGSA
jgi:hypothetical protein